MAEQDIETLIMENCGNDNLDIDFNDLFSDGDYSSVLNDISFSSGLALDNDFQNQSSPPLQSNNNDETSSTTDGNTSLELIRLLTGERQDMIAIVDDEQLNQNPAEHQDPNITNTQIPQQANGNKNEIMYQMHPSLFDMIDGGMSVKQQPATNARPCYESEGVRFLSDSTRYAMSINLPNLQHIQLANNQTLGIVITIVTDTNNPMNQTVLHANDIVCLLPNTEKIGYGCLFVPLETSDKIKSEKKFNRFSVVYKKCDTYTFDLTPFNPSTMFGTTKKYINAVADKKNGGNAAKAKAFKKDYKLSTYKIVFQLALKQDNVVFISNITCETDIANIQRTAQKSVKRSASSMSEHLSDDESSSSTQIPTASKKFKSSTPPLLGLPVTRISSSNANDSTESSTDNYKLSLLNDLIREDDNWRIT